MKEKVLHEIVEELFIRVATKIEQSQSMGCWKECLQDAFDHLTDLESDLDHEINKEINKELTSFEEMPIFRGTRKQLEELL